MGAADRDQGQLGLFGAPPDPAAEASGATATPKSATPTTRQAAVPTTSRAAPATAAAPPGEAATAPDPATTPKRPAPPEDPPRVLGVAEVDRRLQRMLERATARLLVRGEVRGLRRAGSGHLYFTLKDEKEAAVLEAVMYRSASARGRSRVMEGEQVVVAGRITFYPPRGRVQLIVNEVLQTARGALLEALERLKQQLAAEGLFDPVRKRPVPKAPRKIAVVTSRSGAAVHDFIRIAHQRGGGARIVLVDTLVQGPAAPSRIAGAIATADRYLGADVIVVTRGGGSLEDLAAFNDEGVVRAIAACTTPVVSAVGHEIDQCLTDLVADGRAATPSQAAELLVVDARAQHQQLQALRGRLLRGGTQDLSRRRAQLASLRVGLGEPRRLILMSGQRLDELRLDAERAGRRGLRMRRAQLEGWQARLGRQHPRRVLQQAQEALRPLGPEVERQARRHLRTATSHLAGLEARLRHAIGSQMQTARHACAQRVAQLDALSPLAVLARGYAIARREGRVITDASSLEMGDPLEVMLGRGRVLAEVTGTEEPVE
ncbi:MAG: exodeoxyribonuclease VII large subunit [Myxococcota bacterium]